MKMKYMGYTERTIEVRKMTIGDMFVSLCESMITQNATHYEVRFFDASTGTFDKFDNMNAMLTSGWNTSWTINVLKYQAMHDNNNDKDYIFVVYEDAETEDEEEKTEE